MGIFDIFNAGNDENKYKGITLSPDVDVALQKQLIDHGRASEINTMTPSYVAKSMTPEAVDTANASIKQVSSANSTPAIQAFDTTKVNPGDVVNAANQVRGDITHIVADTPIFGVQPAYAPAEENQPGNLPSLEKDYKNSLSYQYLHKENLAKEGFVSGISGGIIKPANEAPTSVADKVISGISNVAGSAVLIGKISEGFGALAAGDATIGALMTKYPTMAKLASNIAGFDIYGQLDPDQKNRFAKLAQDTALAIPFTFLGNIKNAAYSIPASFGLGYGIAKLGGASDEDAIIQGGILSVLDASSRFGGNGIHNVDKVTSENLLRKEAIDTFNKYSDVKVNEKSSPEDIQAAYRSAARNTHPDLNGGEDAAIKSVNFANEVLNPKTQAAYQEKPAETPVANPQDKQVFETAVADLQRSKGDVPDVYSAAVAEAKRTVDVPVEATPNINETPKALYHQTNYDVEAIKENGFVPGKNSVFGEAAFFGEKANDTYGNSVIVIKPEDYNLKKIGTVAEQQKFIKEQGATNLANAVRAEGKYDGFLIPNPEGNVVGITNTEKLNQELKAQQYVTTDEARAMSKNFKFIEDLKLPVVTVDKILTPQGKEAFGKYYKGVISFIENPHKTTLPHEATHAFMDLMMNDKQKTNVINEVKRRYAGKKFNDKQAEEQLAEDFAKYYTAKYDNPEKAKAPSNKLKQLFDWLIDQFKKLFGKGDIIDNFYKDIETSRPGIIKREQIRQRLSKGAYDVASVQQENYQKPDELTTKFLENVDVKNREVSSYEFLKNLLKSKSLPLKEIERNLIDHILDDQFKDDKKINMSDFRDAVKSELLPLKVIESDTYADYGSTALEMSDEFDHTTDIYNSPFDHGYGGYFSQDFEHNIPKDSLEIKEIPGENKWAILKKGQELTEENIAESVYHIASSEEDAKRWIEDKTHYATSVDVGRSGLFGHTRIWKATDNFSKDFGIRYVAEVQSDAFQNEHVNNTEENIKEQSNLARTDQMYIDAWQKAKTSFSKITDETSLEEKGNIRNSLRQEFPTLAAFDIFTAGTPKEINDNINERLGYFKNQLAHHSGRLKELQNQDISKNETNFFQYKNVWHERLIREEIRRAAMDGDKSVRFPTPYTIAKIEGYLSADGQIPEGTSIGNTFEYGGQDYILLKDNNDYMGENTGVSAPYSDVRAINDYNTLRQEDFDSELNDLIEEIKSSDDITDIYNLNNFGELDAKELKSLKKKVDNDEDVSDVLEPVVDKILDDRYTDAESYAEYWNDAGGEEHSFATDDDRVIILNKNDNVETFGIGGNNEDKTDFNYEEDLDGSEQKTVARFYDKQVGRYLAKLRKQNFRIVTDDNGYDWYETDILPEDKTAVEAFQVKKADEPTIKTGREVVKYVDEIEKQKAEDFGDDEMTGIDDYLKGIIKQQNYELKQVSIDSLISQDKDLAEYVSNGEDRYASEGGSDLALPIVVGYWKPATIEDLGVLDGYNRVLANKLAGNKYIEAFVAKPDISKFTGAELLNRLKAGTMAGKQELSEYGINTVGATYGMADVFTVEGHPVAAASWFEDALAGFAVHKDFQHKGVASGLLTRWAEQDGGKLKVYDPNERMTALLNTLGTVSEADGEGNVVLTLDAKFQSMTPGQMADLEYRREQENNKRMNAEVAREENIISAREANLSFVSPEKEMGYANFKKLAARRPWVLDSQTDDSALKNRLPAIDVDNYLFQGARDISNNELLEQFKDRYFQETELKDLVKQKTPTEELAISKRAVEKIVKSETIGRKPNLKQALNVAMGLERPVRISMKETTLLKKKIRDIARGVKMGRSDMRAALNEAFSAKLYEIKQIRRAIIAYANDLPISERGQLLNTVGMAHTMTDLAKAFAKIDAALESSEFRSELSDIKKTAAKLKKAMATGRGIAVDYQKQIADILDDYNLKNPTASTIEKLNGLSDYIARNPEINISDHLVKRLDILKRKNPKDLTVEDLKDLNDLLGRLWSLGELKMKLKTKYDARQLEEAVKKVLTTTINTEDRSSNALTLLHAPRVTDIFDGYRQYKGENVRMQKELSSQVTNAMISGKNRAMETLNTIKNLKDNYSKEEFAAMAFTLAKDQGGNTQAQSILDYYAGEFGWKSEADLQKAITPEVKFAIDSMRAAFNDSVDYLAAVYEEMENKPFIKNDKYFPFKYDYSINKKMEYDTPSVDDFMHEAGKNVEKGFTFKRVKGVKKVLRIDVFHVFAQAMAEQEYYMRVQPKINEISDIVTSLPYQQAAGEVAVRWWDNYLRAVAHRGKGAMTGIWRGFDPALRKIKFNLSNAILGFKLSSAILQPTAIIDAYAYVYLNHGALTANGLILRLAGTLTLPGYAKSIVSKSPGLQLRTGGELTIREMEESPFGTKVGTAFRNAGMWALQKLDGLTASAVDQTMFKYFKRKGMEDGEARREANFVMNITQGSSEIADLPLILTAGELAKTILTFQTFALNRWGLISHDIAKSAIIKGGLSRKLKGLIALFLISLAGGIENLVRSKITEVTTGKKYPGKFNFWQQSLLTTPEAIPVLGNVITSVVEYGKGYSIPLTRVVELLIQGTTGLINPSGQDQATKDKNRKLGALRAAEAIGTIKGVPGSSQLSDFIERIFIPTPVSVSAGTKKATITPTLPKAPKLPALPKAPKLPGVR